MILKIQLPHISRLVQRKIVMLTSDSSVGWKYYSGIIIHNCTVRNISANRLKYLLNISSFNISKLKTLFLRVSQSLLQNCMQYAYLMYQMRSHTLTPKIPVQNLKHFDISPDVITFCTFKLYMYRMVVWNLDASPPNVNY